MQANLEGLDGMSTTAPQTSVAALHNSTVAQQQPARFKSPRKENRAHFVAAHVAVLLGVHALALLSFVPWLFSWSGLIACLVGIYAFGVMGINIGFHRLLTHRSFECSKWVEHALALLGICCLQGAPSRWVALHRIHHQYSDSEEDPHTPLVSFLWAHFEWIMTEDKNRYWLMTYDKYAPDMIRDKFYLAMDRKGLWFFVYVLHAAAFFVVGFTGGWLLPGGSLAQAVQLGSSWLVWGVLARTVLVWHFTWSVNSLTHMTGYRNYETNDESKNNWFVALMSHGEGWHNNHHADPRSAAAGHRWWELDVSYLIIRVLGSMKLVSGIVPVRTKVANRYGPDAKRQAKKEVSETMIAGSTLSPCGMDDAGDVRQSRAA